MRLVSYSLRLTTVLIIGISSHTLAQSVSDTAIHIYETPEVKSIVAKRIEYARQSRGLMKGYRIQINFGQDRNQANQVRGDFANKYPGIAAYMSYQQPYFKVNVGDFSTKLDAVKNLNMIRKTYPGAFIVMDKINASALSQ